MSAGWKRLLLRSTPHPFQRGPSSGCGKPLICCVQRPCPSDALLIAALPVTKAAIARRSSSLRSFAIAAMLPEVSVPST
ncbi:hypothetical protein ABIF65_004384 [Bradyrhizobium japonicum]|uniref:hypothetical protein n=1 Tax=Bradyrhizobium TaxID=374 RepID=UPI00040F057B|nr:MULTISPECIES: hypothetical protein [Bradyrhizobium]MCP1742704.1 hypothetical protein [Bradyrhizobium japonicum]MCP1860417.1 hypothetical protein [Bradyrhizobium japonicum]MCP1891179.1 hypothetical protein [Bradyrhizobium japonicum]MCW2324217.1 hypothetical protein [Bradyrhizobium japonicum]